MRALPILAALAAATPAILAQANCSATGPAATIATQTPFTGNFLYGHPNMPSPPGSTYTGFSFLFDLTLNAPIDITQIDIDLYDAGGLVNMGNGTTITLPNQVGATSTADFFLVPATSWVGNETNPSAWGLLGTGTLTVAGPHADSPIVFGTPLSLPAGLWGIALVVYQTTSGPAPGPLHPMLNDPAIIAPTTFTNPVLTISQLQFQRESWTASLAPVSHWQNIEWHYVQTGYANWTSFGTGCVAPNVPQLALNARPVIGTTVTFQTSNILAGTLLNFWLFGFAPDGNGLDLGAYGLPGCRLYLQLGSAITINVSGVSGGAATVALPIPLGASYTGLVLYGQSAPLTSGFNAGFFASNAVCVALGLN
jgi:hypothetical protein